MAVGPGAVHTEHVEGCVIWENGAEQAKLMAKDVRMYAARSTTASTRSHCILTRLWRVTWPGT